MAVPTYSAASAVAHSVIGDQGGSHSIVTFTSYVVPSLTNGYMLVAIGNRSTTSPIAAESVVWNTSTNLASLGAVRYSDLDTTSGIELWGIKAPPAATANLVVTISAVDYTYAYAMVMLFEGVDQTTPTAGYVTATGGPGSPATATADVSASANDLIVAAYLQRDQDGWTLQGGQTSILQSTGDLTDGIMRTGYLAAAGATTTMAAQATVTATWLEAAIALKQVSGGATGGLMWL